MPCHVSYYYVVCLKIGEKAASGRTWELVGVFAKQALAARAAKAASCCPGISAAYMGEWNLIDGFYDAVCISLGSPCVALGELVCDFLESAPAVGIQAVSTIAVCWATGTTAGVMPSWVGAILPFCKPAPADSPS